MPFNPKRLLAVAAAWLGLVVVAQAAPPMWVASDADTRIWLFGSVHILPKGIEWRTPAFDEALAKSDHVYFEASLDAANQQTLAAETYRLGLVDSGTRLLDGLDPGQKDVVTRAARLAGVPLSGLNIWKPWMAANLLTTSFAARQGYDPLSGVDMVLQSEVPQNRQRFFETIDEQLHLMADLPAAKQIDLLVATARDLENSPGSLNDLVSAWSQGDTDSLEANFSEGLEAVDASWSEALLHKRNQRWAKDISSLIATPGDIMVVVGAAHLIGNGSLPALLKAGGIEIERVQ